MPEFSDAVVGITKTLLWKREAPEQGGLLSGQDPSAFNPVDPLRLWIIQVGVIVLMTQLLSLFLRKIRQPKVIAEVLGGILLGPTAFGRIPGFTQHIFPQDSRPYLSLVANIGLCLFLFLVGLEIDAAVIKRNARLSATVALAGMCLPFGLGAALSVPLYHTFIDSSVKFTHFMLFTGVAYSITAFPVLCRILTELKLLDTTVGIVVLSAGVGNDIVGWTLLALSVALVNAGSGLMALWILLTCVGWTLLLLFPVRIVLHWLARRTGSIENGPTIFFMTVIILVLFGSAFMTDVIGVHAIFGAFLAGIIVPRDGGLAIALTEKLEDMTSIIFLPLYFTLSGLSTDLGLLNTGQVWGYTIAICALAYFGKFGGCTVAARISGFNWRESSTIGSLMSCKGLVELIVLNVGLSAGILSQRVFSMFVLEALLLTFMTTPAVTFLYPPELRVRAVPTGANFANVPEGTGKTPDSPAPGADGGEDGLNGKKGARGDGFDGEGNLVDRFLVVLDRLEHLPGIMALTQLIQPPPAYSEQEPPQSPRSPLPSAGAPTGTEDTTATDSSAKSNGKRSASLRLEEEVPHAPQTTENGISISALRLIELTDRTSAVMKYSSFSAETLVHTDPLLSIYRAFLELGGSGGGVGTEVRMVPYDGLAESVRDETRRRGSQMVLIPWLPAFHHSNPAHAVSPTTDTNPTSPGLEPVTPRTIINNPFEGLFKGSNSGAGSSGVGSSSSTLHSHFIRSVFAQSEVDVALYVDQDQQGHPDSSPIVKSISGGRHHIFLPFFGGPDDRLALEFVAQVCRSNPRVSASVVRFVKTEDVLVQSSSVEKPDAAHLKDDRAQTSILGITSPGQTTFPDTVYGNATTQTRLQSETADNIVWARYADAEIPYPRMTFSTITTPTPLHSVIGHISSLLSDPSHRGLAKPKPLVVCGRSRRLAVENHHVELRKVVEEYGTAGYGSEVRKTLGDVAAAVVFARCQASITVLQAAATHA